MQKLPIPPSSRTKAFSNTRVLIPLAALGLALGCGVSSPELPTYSNGDQDIHSDPLQERVVASSDQAVDGWNDEEDVSPPPGGGWGYGDNAYQVANGKLVGGLGPVDFESTQVEVGSWSDFQYAEVWTVVDATQGVGGAAMSVLEFYGGLENPALAPGATLSFQDGYATDPDVDLALDVVGCSGSQVGDWDYFDVPASDAQVQVEETDTPGVLLLSYRASFIDYAGSTGSVTGAFTYVTSPVQP